MQAFFQFARATDLAFKLLGHQIVNYVQPKPRPPLAPFGRIKRIKQKLRLIRRHAAAVVVKMHLHRPVPRLGEMEITPFSMSSNAWIRLFITRLVIIWIMSPG